MYTLGLNGFTAEERKPIMEVAAYSRKVYQPDGSTNHSIEILLTPFGGINLCDTINVLSQELAPINTGVNINIVFALIDALEVIGQGVHYFDDLSNFISGNATVNKVPDYIYFFNYKRTN